MSTPWPKRFCPNTLRKVVAKVFMWVQMTITLDNGNLGLMVVTFSWVVVTLP